MKKIVFCDIPMKKELDAQRYEIDGNFISAYDKQVVFPINAVLAKSLQKGEKVKVVLLKTLDREGNSDLNAGEFMKELNAINRDIGAEIEYETIDSEFKETRETHEKLLRKMIGKLEANACIYGDITYGPKPLPIVTFSVFNFAEKFFNADIKNIVYGKVDFVDDGSGTGKTKPVNPVLYDLTPLYYLDSVTKAMDAENSEEAVKMLDVVLSI